MILVVGLGNPGSKYENTKHNLGARVIDEICSSEKIKISFNKKMCAYLGEGRINDENLLFAKPQSFVNQSGTVVHSIVKYFKVNPQSELIVVCDDMDLPVGRIRIREKGTSGGHKGLESIIKALGSPNFIRVRIGIGKPLKEDVVEYVLSPFKKSELEIIKNSIYRARDAIKVIIQEGVGKAMSIYNREE